MGKNIIIIGCGGSGSVKDAINRINEHAKCENPAVFHDTPPDISKSELKELALGFQKQGMEVLIVNDSFDITKELTPKPDFNDMVLKITEMPKMNDYVSFDEPRDVNPNNRGHKGKKKYWNKRGK